MLKFNYTIRCSKFCVHGKICSWHNGYNIKFSNYIKSIIDSIQGNEEDEVILYELVDLYDKETVLSFSNGSGKKLMIHFFYIKEQDPIFVGIYQMNVEGAINCKYDLNTNPQHINCPNERIDVTSVDTYK